LVASTGAAIILLSKDFVCKKWPMRELHRLLNRLEQPGNTSFQIIPVLYGIKYDELSNLPMIHRQYQQQHNRAPDADIAQCIADVERLKRITGLRRNQVSAAGAWHVTSYPCGE
jgi:hypothetical protein